MSARLRRFGWLIVLVSLATGAPHAAAESVYPFTLLVRGREVGTEQVTLKPESDPPAIETVLVRRSGEDKKRLRLSTNLDPATRLPALHVFRDDTNRIAIEFGPDKLSLTREDLQSGQKTPATIEVSDPAVLVNFDSAAEYQIVINAVIEAGGGPAQFQLLGLRRGDFSPGRVHVVKRGQTAVEGAGALTEWILYTPYRAARLWTDTDNVLYYAVVPSQHYELVREGGKRLAPPSAEPPSYVQMGRFMEVHTWLPGGLYDIPAILSIPQNLGARAPAVLLLQGRGARDADGTVGRSAPNRDLAWGLASQGMVVMRFAKRSFAYQKSIDTERITVEQDIVEDAHRALRELRRQLMVDRSRVYIVGWGLGGRLAPRIAAAAAEHGAPVAGVIALDSPSQPMDESMLAQTQYLERAVGVDPQKLKRTSTNIRNFMKQLRAGRASRDAVIMGIGVPYWEGLLESDLEKSLEKADFPVLAVMPQRSFLTGKTDIERWRKLLEAHAEEYPRSKVLTMPELGHFLMYGKGKEMPYMFSMGDSPSAEAIARIAEWIQKDDAE